MDVNETVGTVTATDFLAEVKSNLLRIEPIELFHKITESRYESERVLRRWVPLYLEIALF